MTTDAGGGHTETPQTSEHPDALDRTADALKGDDDHADRELDAAQDSLDSRLEREGADQSEHGR